VLTFFPWQNARRGVRGMGETAAVAYSVPFGSLPAWRERLARHNVEIVGEETRFGEKVLALLDPDGMRVEIVESAHLPAITTWDASPVPAEIALRGFHSVTLQVREAGASAVLLTENFGWQHTGSEGNRHRYGVAGEVPGRVVDLLETPDAPAHVEGFGSVHHVAFRTANEATELQWRDLLLAERFNVTEVRDREYFRSIYFREPNGVLYEIATDTPGFATDESAETLGSKLMLPAWYEPRREEIVARLPPIRLP
jgi:glyoxalase family protein